MSTIKATGHFTDAAPTVTISGGGGNTDRPEIHLMMRDTSDEQTRTLIGWFDREELLAAINASPTERVRLVREAA